MANGLISKLSNIFKTKDVDEQDEKLLHTVSVGAMDTRFKMGDLVGSAVVLRHLLEAYGERKKQNHRQKGRRFIEFILSSKHQDLKNIGYKHWQNINKIIHLNQSTIYPYHQQNLEQAIAFFKKEVKGIHQIRIVYNDTI